ncbi:ComF family protein [Chitinimonas arctica]|uniref:ComF family protein n=1 Tax=Chitinimonas arctica TaxID=2594795 RepID=A0A516SC10_9NEIS|nr:ComF family protein [Chitinimonas arctica]QDQ25682.1 ComF family protein [Chitinimonas arctica]
MDCLLFKRLYQRLSGLAAGLVEICLPQACVLCGGGSGEQGICSPCLADLPWLDEAYCPACGLPSPLAERCGACTRSPPAFDSTLAAWRYEWPLDRLIPAYKYGGQLILGAALADGLLARLRARPRPDCLLAMPLHPQRLRERGFNQSHELARRLARKLELPLLHRGIARILHTPPQASLALAERRKALRDAFTVERDLHGMRIAVVDDVMTTGASLDALANALKAAGAFHVDCWVLARTI